MANWEFQWGGEDKSGYIGLMTAGETLGMGINDLAAKPDYKVGTWTPRYKPETGDDFASATYDIQEGFYIKVNAFYFCTFAMRTDAALRLVTFNCVSSFATAKANFTGSVIEASSLALVEFLPSA